MRLFLIGKLFTGRTKLLAYKLYDADSKKTGIYAKENVHYRILNDHVSVAGLYASPNGTVKNTAGAFNSFKIDKLNGSGEPIEESGRYILVGLSGFLENTKYRIVNSRGEEKIINQNEFESMVGEDRIMGAKLKKPGEIYIRKKCAYREYNY